MHADHRELQIFDGDLVNRFRLRLVVFADRILSLFRGGIDLVRNKIAALAVDIGTHSCGRAREGVAVLCAYPDAEAVFLSDCKDGILGQVVAGIGIPPIDLHELDLLLRQNPDAVYRRMSAGCRLLHIHDRDSGNSRCALGLGEGIGQDQVRLAGFDQPCRLGVDAGSDCRCRREDTAVTGSQVNGYPVFHAALKCLIAAEISAVCYIIPLHLCRALCVDVILVLAADGDAVILRLSACGRCRNAGGADLRDRSAGQGVKQIDDTDRLLTVLPDRADSAVENGIDFIFRCKEISVLCLIEYSGLILMTGLKGSGRIERLAVRTVSPLGQLCGIFLRGAGRYVKARVLSGNRPKDILRRKIADGNCRCIVITDQRTDRVA